MSETELTEHFLKLGNKLTKHTSGSFLISIRKFRSFFGVAPNICALIWSLLNGKRDRGSKPIHLLWALLFLNKYDTEELHAAITEVDVKTFRKWSWTFINLISNLDVVRMLIISWKNTFIYFYSKIKWENRFMNSFPGQNCYVSLDGTDFMILEPTPFEKKWFSHKFKGPGVKYEIGVCIQNGWIVWTNGGVPCGEFSDLKLAREAYIFAVEEDELTLADKGYNDMQYFVYPVTNDSTAARQKEIMARHETVNMRIKRFGVMQKIFRHNLLLHPKCFHAVVNIVQLSIENGEPLYCIQ